MGLEPAGIEVQLDIDTLAGLDSHLLFGIGLAIGRRGDVIAGRQGEGGLSIIAVGIHLDAFGLAELVHPLTQYTEPVASHLLATSHHDSPCLEPAGIQIQLDLFPLARLDRNPLLGVGLTVGRRNDVIARRHPETDIGVIAVGIHLDPLGLASLILHLAQHLEPVATHLLAVGGHGGDQMQIDRRIRIGLGHPLHRLAQGQFQIGGVAGGEELAAGLVGHALQLRHPLLLLDVEADHMSGEIDAALLQLSGHGARIGIAGLLAV